MSSAPKRLRQVAINGTVLSRDTVCKSCFDRLSQQSRRYAAAAAVASADEASSTNERAARDAGPAIGYRLLISSVVSRSPLLTRELTTFEKSYYLYQKRLNERLAQPLTRYFYYKRGSPSDAVWKRKIRSRQTPARDVGIYNAYDKFGWNDEVLLDSKLGEPDSIREALFRDAEGRSIVDGTILKDQQKETDEATVAGDPAYGEGTRQELQVELDRPLSRTTPADEGNDMNSLSRKMDRTLYLLVKDADGEWRFPQDRQFGKESLHQTAERVIVQAAGVNMNTWVVGNQPVGHFVANFAQPILSKVKRLLKKDAEPIVVERQEHGEKVFFMKARILAGQADLKNNQYGSTEFQWLTKEEIEGKVTNAYWQAIRNMLTER